MTASREADRTRKRYNRIAPIYNTMEWGVERIAFKMWRDRLWSSLGRRSTGPRSGSGDREELPLSSCRH